jgi:DNA-binding transcriptional ArsR family regulator
MFKMTIASSPQRILNNDVERNLAYFLSDIGYIPRMNPDTDMDTIRRSAGFRLFHECFLRDPQKYWEVEEIMSYLGISRTTLYRHLNKLKSMDVLEEAHGGRSKNYRLRGGSLESAWNWVEINVRMTMENYRKIVDTVWNQAKKLP